MRGGYAICGYCGTNLAATKHAPTGLRSYRCQSSAGQRGEHTAFSMMAPTLDAVVWEWVKERIGHPETLRAELELHDSENPHAVEVGAIERQLAKIVSRQEKTSRAIGLMDDDDALTPVSWKYCEN